MEHPVQNVLCRCSHLTSLMCHLRRTYCLSVVASPALPAIVVVLAVLVRAAVVLMVQLHFHLIDAIVDKMAVARSLHCSCLEAKATSH